MLFGKNKGMEDKRIVLVMSRVIVKFNRNFKALNFQKHSSENAESFFNEWDLLIWLWYKNCM